MENKIIYFDMDNTLNKLSCVKDVWKKLDTFDVSPYIEAEPKQHYIDMLKSYHANGYMVVILSCLSRITNDRFDEETINAKNEWLQKYVGMENIDECMYIPYTKHKEQYCSINGTLVDDDIVIGTNWNLGDVIIAK